MFRRLIFTSFTVFAISNIAYADVLVTLQSDDGGKSEIKLSKEWAKIADQSDRQQYMLVNLKNNRPYMIDNEQKIAVDMEGMNAFAREMTGNTEPQKPQFKISLDKKGSGPTIAGYKTTRYLLTAEGQLCSENFLSKKPYDLQEIKAFSTTMEKLASTNIAMEDFSTPCDYAEFEFERMTLSEGMPLLSKDPSGRETFRILEIKANLSYPDSEFATPKGYKVVTAKELMQQQMSQAMPDMPSEHELKQMEEGLHQLEQMLEPMAEQ